MATTTSGTTGSPANDPLCAAEMLEGVELDGGWKVMSKVTKVEHSTGGHFSAPYYVERIEHGKMRRAFLKALNFRQLAAAADFAKAVQEQTAIFNFERETLELCRDKKLRRVAMVIDAGEYRPPSGSLPVCYIIFELADHGDARAVLAKLQRLDLSWTLRTLHQTAVALRQLHGEGIAHQDVKPSNVLFFETFGAKLADLGCADLMKNPAASPRGRAVIAGDMSYAPPELFYGEIAPDWKVRRFGCDLYLLGSLVVFLFTGGASMNSMLWPKLSVDHRPSKWAKDYRTALPYVRDAFEQALIQIAGVLPDSVRERIIEIIRWLCEPDPRRRGHPTDLDVSQFNLERVISAFDVLATKAEHRLLKA